LPAYIIKKASFLGGSHENHHQFRLNYVELLKNPAISGGQKLEVSGFHIFLPQKPPRNTEDHRGLRPPGGGQRGPCGELGGERTHRSDDDEDCHWDDGKMGLVDLGWEMMGHCQMSDVSFPIISIYFHHPLRDGKSSSWPLWAYICDLVIW